MGPERPKAIGTKCEDYMAGDQSVFSGLVTLSVCRATEELSKEMAEGERRLLTVGLRLLTVGLKHDR